MREQLRVGSALCWTAAWLLAIAAPVLFLLEPTSETWWTWLLVLPLVGLVLWREDRMGFAQNGGGSLGGDDGPWGPPPGL